MSRGAHRRRPGRRSHPPRRRRRPARTREYAAARPPGHRSYPTGFRRRQSRAWPSRQTSRPRRSTQSFAAKPGCSKRSSSRPCPATTSQTIPSSVAGSAPCANSPTRVAGTTPHAHRRSRLVPETLRGMAGSHDDGSTSRRLNPAASHPGEALPTGLDAAARPGERGSSPPTPPSIVSARHG